MWSRTGVALGLLSAALAACSAEDSGLDDGDDSSEALATAAPAPIHRPELTARHVADAAIAIDGKLDPAWTNAPAITFDTLWSGAHSATSTSVRVLWSEHALYMFWELEGAAGVNTDASRPVDVERTNLFVEDCVEVFLAPDPAERRRYFEIELGPMGHFFDLLIDRRHGSTSDERWTSNAEIKTSVDREAHRTVIEVALRNPELVAALHPDARLPIGLFRQEGKAPRQFLAWSPTLTPHPNFHVPDALGTLVLARP